jgi:parallel beta-helix repeat protein
MTTYYVRPVNGSDANAGTSYGAAKATLQAGVDLLSSGDRLIACAEADEEIDSQVSWTFASSSTTPTQIIGANSAGVIDGTRYVLKPSSSFTGTMLLAPGAVSASYMHVNYIEANCNANGVQVDYGLGAWSSGGTGQYIVINKCHAYGAGVSGIYFRNESRPMISGCVSYNNVVHGIAIGASGGFSIGGEAYGNLCYGNGFDGIRCQDQLHRVIGNICVHNTGNGIYFWGPQSNITTIYGNTFCDNDGHGIEWAATATGIFAIYLHNNTICNNGGYGVDDGDSGNNFTARQIQALHNHFYGNTSNPTTLGTTLPEFESIDGDPLFTDSANRDYTLQSGSPLIGAGMAGSTIGALGLASAGGGGGTRKLIGIGNNPLIGVL